MSQTAERTDYARQQARAQLDFIVELMNAAQDAANGDDVTFEGEEMDLLDLEDRGREWPLSVLVRSGWQSPGEPLSAVEYEILLCTGGPAVRVRGNLSEYGEPETACIETQDWFTAWSRFPATTEEQEALVSFVGLFWFGG